jgi:hypothetical protein
MTLNLENPYSGTEINANLVCAACTGLGSINYQYNCLPNLNHHGLQVSAGHRVTAGRCNKPKAVSWLVRKAVY